MMAGIAAKLTPSRAFRASSFGSASSLLRPHEQFACASGVGTTSCGTWRPERRRSAGRFELPEAGILRYGARAVGFEHGRERAAPALVPVARLGEPLVALIQRFECEFRKPQPCSAHVGPRADGQAGPPDGEQIRGGRE